MNFLRDLDVLVLGLGESGLAMARWCARHGARVRVWDSRDQPPHADTLRAEWPTVERLSGDLGDGLPTGVQLVLKSPGLMPHDMRIAPLLASARATGVAVMAELDLFVQALADLKLQTTPMAAEVAGTTEPRADDVVVVVDESDDRDDSDHSDVDDEPAPVLVAPPPPDPAYAPQIVAITGTNGKTTTTAMAALLIERSGRRVAMAGNIMPTMLDRLGAMLERPRDDWAQVWVLELSSFQLADSGPFEPSAAAVLNLSQDHLDWHGDTAAYASAKARIFGQQATMIINRDDAQVEALVPAPVVSRVGRGKPVSTARRVLRFGVTPPERPGDFGLVVENGMAWLVRALPVDETLKRRKDEVDEIHLQRLMPADALRVRGRHNAANALAALALATAIGCPLAPMLHGLREYTGEPHRVQWIATLGEVEAFDDSKGTNVGATVAALEGLGSDKAPGKLLLILGGDGKGQDFGPLRNPVQQHARAVALIGRDAATIAAVLADTGVPMQHHVSLPEAVAWCFEQARAGDAVLLSPACASLDMFGSYVQRGEVFVDAVRALAADRGQSI
ncbi:MAG: UDP-N-acetylmuramoyl-L-alanine--D-glutamate ligase [Rubrivivax sp.]|nr:UDP-N-acetylmuramoyl-L-alanine--D-glutamate ligase [Rubrivivax sp.]MBK7261074.1 UDP-N-acetylmuramoyl-L-alanine--D-glutamate ligase [Rubrivivax sp.]MBK8529856.1 UDP-N-acetylmuramoyl-L-alanine--D-glutamate ligase [Rubrivivax sp.]